MRKYGEHRGFQVLWGSPGYPTLRLLIFLIVFDGGKPGRRLVHIAEAQTIDRVVVTRCSGGVFTYKDEDPCQESALFSKAARSSCLMTIYAPPFQKNFIPPVSIVK